MILSFQHLQGPSGRLKTLGYTFGFQHFPLELANVNEWKIMFDPSITITTKCSNIAQGQQLSAQLVVLTTLFLCKAS